MPYCSKCGAEYKEGASFCPSCGSPISVSPPPAPPAGGVPPSGPILTRPEANILVQRIIAVIIDSVIVAIISLIIGVLIGLAIGFAFLFAGFAFIYTPFSVIFLLLGIAYFTYFEGTSGQTIGKRLLGIKVISASTTSIDMTKALNRNILRVVDWLPGAYILGFILILVSQKKQRLGDMLAETQVVRA
jgi:uncharacterized RDD family membrane protein YckC